VAAADPAVSGQIAPGAYPLADGMAPVLRSALLERGDPLIAGSRDRLVLVFSEPVDISTARGALLSALGVARGAAYGMVLEAPASVGSPETGPGEAAYAFNLIALPAAGGGEAKPESGDSAWIDPVAGLADLAGNVQRNPANRRVALRVKEPLHLDVLPIAPGGVTRGLPHGPGDPVWSVYGGPGLQGLAGKDALPVRPGRPEAARFGGLAFEASAPFDLDVRVFTNAGEFVSRVEARIAATDFSRLEPGAMAGTRRISLLWNGRAANGQLAATGTYLYKFSMRVHGSEGIRDHEGVKRLGILRGR
jgi:hypothetical protein